MNSLDRLFGEALDRAAMPTTQERRGAVAEVTVHGARRRRRVRAAAQVGGALALAAVLVLAAGLFLNRADAPPANATPTPPQPTPSAIASAPPDVATELDPRLAPARAMTGEDWNNLSLTWDAEMASFIGGGKDVYGSVLAIYLTPPGGSRILAYSNSTSFTEAPSLLGFDAETRSAIVGGLSPTGGVSALNLLTGDITDMPLGLEEPVSGSAALGKLSNGDSLFAVGTVGSNNSYEVHVFRTFNNTAIPVTSGEFDVSPVWGDRLVVTTDDAFTFLDADAEPPAEIPAPEDCAFFAWHTDGTFVAMCGFSTGEITQYQQVDPEAGTSTVLWERAEDGSEDPLPASLDEPRAVDQVRAWVGLGIGIAPALPIEPPQVYENGVQVADLADGFSEQPKSYGIIFGFQHPPGQ
ncbi:hypothetical protein [Demequina sp.]|uniref:hypothetical protein n=1 Tax=Demequina sp. TaxID=2050685 RepID=UPI003D1251D8